ncbi:hypothetical protein PSN45_000136 [Yamadazyma tenuis]|uniref:uncharacterized protein n=1 Tax=Candida tenuis TaxID=2315449 RepID=UPI0027A85015|nr:hypothetical protein PSN45_000136 [Yamadazyma tenuis]
MATQHLESYHKWLLENAFWNDEVVETKTSSIGGVGVFWKHPDMLEDSLLDGVLLRVPKSNILSSKNSSIYNLLVDHQEIYGDMVPDINLSEGMHSLIIAFVYELSMGQSSPWYDYLKAIDPQATNIELPICLWTHTQRELLNNTECKTLGMLHMDELVALFEECIRFAKNNAKYVDIPSIFKIESSVKDDQKFAEYKKNLTVFGACIQSVVSRAFQVDDFHGPSLVPGADLFNHLSPTIDDEGQVIERENVHFVCDGGENVCGECGEHECDHMFEDSDEDDDSDEHLEEHEHQNGCPCSDQEDGNNGDEDIDVSAVEYSDVEVEESEAEQESEQESQTDEVGDDSSSDSEVGEITMELIQQLEREENEDSDSDEESEPAEDNFIEDTNSDADTTVNQDLKMQLLDSSKCVDIVLTSLPSAEYDFEVFNTYGNDLPNPYLLQRYGFVCKPNEANINDSCSLQEQLTKYVSGLESRSGTNKANQLKAKLSWLESNFDLVAEIVHEVSRAQLDDDDDDEDDEDDDNDPEDDEYNFPEDWRSSVKVHFNGSLSIHTFLILRLILLPFKIFYLKLHKCRKSKLDQQIVKYLLDTDSYETEINKILKGWCENKLKGYPSLKPLNHKHENSTDIVRFETTKNLVEQEVAIIERALSVLS